MEFLSRTFRILVHRLSTTESNPSSKEANRMNAYLNALHKVLVGDNPKLNFMALAVLIVLLRLIQTFELKFYSAVGVICLMMVVGDYFFEQRDLRARRSDALQQILEMVMSVISYLCGLRRSNPSGFCVAFCGIFFTIMVIAANLSGYAVMYLVLMIVFTAPLMYKKIPSEYIMSVRQIVTNTVHLNEGVLAESELIPFIENKDFNDQDADLESLLTDKTADSATNSLIGGITSMPSHLDAEGGSLDGLEEEDLEFAIRATPAISITPGELSSDSDSDHKSMSFESSHFNRDSSSEDENYYVKGLQFSEITRDITDSRQTQESSSDKKGKSVQDGNSSTQAAGILSSLSAISSNMITDVIKNAITNRTSKQNDSDSDFEIIDSDEIDNDVVN